MNDDEVDVDRYTREPHYGTAVEPQQNRNKMHKVPEIDALMRIYGDRVNVVFDSDP
jgi:hypothetical protein